MNLPSYPSENNRPFLTWQRIIDWGQEHYRYRSFDKDEKIPTRQGLLYIVQKGTIRLVGKSQLNTMSKKIPFQLNDENDLNDDSLEEAFLGFVRSGQPFEIVDQSGFGLEAFAHVDETDVLWFYWHDLDNWPAFRKEVLEAFKYQHQRKLLWLSILGKRRTIDRLFGFLTLLVEEFGESTKDGYYLPFPLTHSQIGSAIGSTRVTVTRLMGKLRKLGLVYNDDDNFICIHIDKSG